MKLNVFVDKTKEEKIDIFIHEERKIIDDIRDLISRENILLCYKNAECHRLSFSDIVLFSVENDKVYAYSKNEKYTVKERLYMIEEKMPDYFIKLNQSALSNIREIKKFDCSVSGTLKVSLKNGLTDFVSRRQLKAVKERLGL